MLSGFLVSGLLFNEFKKSRQVNIKRFLIRRGFKIYPAFYVFLFIALITEKYWFRIHYPLQNILSELFFMQSYFNGCFLHTWSLAIEEHFYILLSVFILASVHYKWILNKRLMIGFFGLSILLVFLLRSQYVVLHIQEPSMHFFKTHLRIDGLLIGVLVSYYYHFSTEFNTFILKHKISLILTSSVFTALPFVFSAGSFFMLTFGLTIMQAGFGIIVALAVVFSSKLSSYRFSNLYVTNIIAYVGQYSYSIYLWHLFLYKILCDFLGKEPPVIIYFSVTILGGIGLSIIIEHAFLKIRDKYFPSGVVRII